VSIFSRQKVIDSITIHSLSLFLVFLLEIAFMYVLSASHVVFQVQKRSFVEAYYLILWVMICRAFLVCGLFFLWRNALSQCKTRLAWGVLCFVPGVIMLVFTSFVLQWGNRASWGFCNNAVLLFFFLSLSIFPEKKEKELFGGIFVVYLVFVLFLPVCLLSMQEEFLLKHMDGFLLSLGVIVFILSQRKVVQRVYSRMTFALYWFVLATIAFAKISSAWLYFVVGSLSIVIVYQAHKESKAFSVFSFIRLIVVLLGTFASTLHYTRQPRAKVEVLQPVPKFSDFFSVRVIRHSSRNQVLIKSGYRAQSQSWKQLLKKLNKYRNVVKEQRNVFIQTDKYVALLHPKRKKALWRFLFRHPGKIRKKVHVCPKYIITNDSKFLFAIKSKTGETLWKKPIHKFFFAFWSSIDCERELFLFSLKNGVIQAVSTKTGRVKWSAKMSDDKRHRLLGGNNQNSLVYVTNRDRTKLFRLQVANGDSEHLKSNQCRWHHANEKYVIGKTRRAICFVKQSKSHSFWSFQLPREETIDSRYMTKFSTESSYPLVTSRRLVLISPVSKRALWSYPLLEPTMASVSFYQKDIIVLSDKKRVIFLHAKTGSVLWKHMSFTSFNQVLAYSEKQFYINPSNSPFVKLTILPVP
jgi:hypothetical protein